MQKQNKLVKINRFFEKNQNYSLKTLLVQESSLIDLRTGQMQEILKRLTVLENGVWQQDIKSLQLISAELNKETYLRSMAKLRIS